MFTIGKLSFKRAILFLILSLIIISQQSYSQNNLVKLEEFTVINKNNISQLHWQSFIEINIAYFNVQRSVDNFYSFSTIEKINANHNNSNIINHDLTDNLYGINGSKVFYRLEVVDINGATSYSDIKNVSIDAIGTFAISPNPVSNLLTVQGSDLRSVRITDINGRVVISKKKVVDNSILIDVSSLAPGMYIVHGQNNNNNLQSQNLIVGH